MPIPDPLTLLVALILGSDPPSTGILRMTSEQYITSVDPSGPDDYRLLGFDPAFGVMIDSDNYDTYFGGGVHVHGSLGFTTPGRTLYGRNGADSGNVQLITVGPADEVQLAPGNADVLVSGAIINPQMPVTDPMTFGAIWSDGGTLKISGF